MKKVFCMILALLSALSLVACSAPKKDVGRNPQGKTVEEVIDERKNETEEKKEVKEPSSDTASKKTSDTVSEKAATPSPVDVDLTTMTSTMVYAEVNQMLTTPQNYMGKTVRMKGSFTYSGSAEKYYFACIIADATACCQQGIEFDLKDGRTFPDEYPDPGTEITVSGVFNTYYEGEMQYCQLKEAVLE